MSWALGKKLNSQIANVPLNHLIWLNDYKTYGSDSYVSVDTDKYDELMRNYNLTMNDPLVMGEALEYAIANDEFGRAIANYKKISDASVFNGITSFIDLLSSRDALSVAFNDSTMCLALMRSENFISALYSNTENVDVLESSEALANIMSIYKEGITSAITVTEPMFILDVVCNSGYVTGANTQSGLPTATCRSGANYNDINGENVVVAVATGSGSWGGSSLSNITKNVNSFATKIQLVNGSYTWIDITATSNATANIVRLPLAK